MSRRASIDCTLCEMGPSFPTLEQAERWIVDHFRFFHPDKLASVQRQILDGSVARAFAAVPEPESHE
jgi:hypothetical protein